MSVTSRPIADLSAEEKRTLLRQLLRQKASRTRASRGEEGQNGEHETLCPLSHGQRALWFIHQLDPQSAAYNVSAALRVRSRLEIPALRRAFQGLVDRHASLRTTFAVWDGEPLQQIHGRQEVCFEQIEASAWSEEALHERLVAEAHRPFDLGRGPLLRVRLFDRAAKEPILLLTVHHIVVDLWSLVVLVEEVQALYAAETAGLEAVLPPLRFEYTDYVRWQAELLAGPEGERLWAYWQQQMAGELPVLALPTDRPRPPVQTYRGATISFRLDESLTARLKHLAKSEGTTLYTILLAAFYVLLHRYTGQEEIVVGSPAAGRSRPEFERTVGYFASPLALRVRLDPDFPFRDLLARVRATVLGALEHQEYPAALLVERLKLARTPSRSPLFDCMLVLNQPFRREPPVDGAGPAPGALALEPLALESRVAMFDLLLMLVETGGSLSASLQYNTDLFEAATAARMAGHFQRLIEGIVRDPGQPPATLPLLTDAERHQLLVEWNATAVPALATDPRCIHHLFEEQVERAPGAVAVSFRGETLTYAELNRRANQLARRLQRLGVGPEKTVAICLERSPERIVALLGALKAGGAYLPLDLRLPPERLAFMLDDARPAVLLTQGSLRERLPIRGGGHEPVLLCLDGDRAQIARERETNPQSDATAENLAYIIYTSGSTGRPKGVLLPHRGLSNFVQDHLRRLGVGPESRMLQFASFSFDASVSEIFTALIGGARLCLADQEVLLAGPDLARFLYDEAITHCILPPSVLKLLPPDGLPALQCLVSAGESCSREVWARLRVGRRFFNGYGPTEATVGPLLHEVIDVPEWATSVPIGRPLANTQVYILDRRLQPVPIGVPGEIHIGGVGVARGYLNRPELTAEKFISSADLGLGIADCRDSQSAIPNPHSAIPRLYRTGDLGRFLPDGTIEFLGRLDHQVKVRGFRIELGEIEAALERHPAVREAVVVCREASPGDRRLVAYVLPEADHNLELWPSAAEFLVYDDLLYYAMTHDERRNESYRGALSRRVNGKVALDIGAGKDAILARLCVEAGARRVYAIELLEPSYRQAKACVERLGLQDRIHLIHGDATRVQLPEPVDVCVSEIVGSIGGSEGAALILRDAKRFLKPEGVIIPERSVTRIAAVTLPDAFVGEPGFAPLAAEYVERIFAQVGYPFDLRLCVKGVTPEHLISTAGVFEDLDFTAGADPEYCRDVTLTITRDSRLHGFLVWLNLYPDAQERIDILEHEHCWLPILLPAFDPAVDVARGDRIHATITARLCENGRNPDYQVKGRVTRASLGRDAAEPPVIRFEYTSYHNRRSYRQTPFYQRLFAGDSLPVRATSRARLSNRGLREFLKEQLPEYMLPSTFVVLDELPRTPGGKVDRGALPAPNGARPEVETAYVMPRNDLERAIAAIWCEALGVEKVGVQDNFFDLGGHSLLAVSVHGKLQQLLGKELSMVELFQYPTVSALAGHLAGAVEPNGAPAGPTQSRARGEQQRAMLARLAARGAARSAGRRSDAPESGEPHLPGDPAKVTQ